MVYNKNALSVGLEEEDCCQQSDEDFRENFLQELCIACDQPRGCHQNDNAHSHVDTFLPFNYTMIEHWAKF